MLFVGLGFLIGTIGTLIGAGGGFMLVPILLFLYPAADNTWIAAVSLWAVAVNATSGSVTYLLKKRVHTKAALVFILTSVPGSMVGVWVEQMVDRHSFELIFAAVLILYSLFLLTKGEKTATVETGSKLPPRTYAGGAAISFFIGALASFLGIGGGVIHVPLLTHLLGFPVHLATGTSHVILAVTAIVATTMNFFNGTLHWQDPLLWQLALGALIGAQVGAALSPKVPGQIILKILAIALFLVGVRLLGASLLF